ncbi:MAG: sigma-70 family RNA polymerase sigma factor [Candidatus Latescibacteria bacterium]|nr:sigma-70 family RNA polymerase sigma factor [Candidatus Latescibacterota bacterium]
MVQRRNDDELVATALAGGPEAFNAIVERYRGQVYGVALARLCNFDEADDIAQQVFIEAYAGLQTLRNPGRLGPWLRRAATHRSIDLLRQKRAHLELSEVAAELATDLTPEVELERSQLRQHVLAAISRLSQVQRETTTLFYLGGHSVEVVAAMQEVPVGTVKRRLHDARSCLKRGMLRLVAETLSDESPSGSFSDQVLEVLLAAKVTVGLGAPWVGRLPGGPKLGPCGPSDTRSAFQPPHPRGSIGGISILRF